MTDILKVQSFFVVEVLQKDIKTLTKKKIYDPFIYISYYNINIMASVNYNRN